MCCILQKWFYICSCVKHLVQIYNKKIDCGYNYYRKCNYGKVLCVLLPCFGNGVPCNGFFDCVEVSLFDGTVLCDGLSSHGNKRALSQRLSAP